MDVSQCNTLYPFNQCSVCVSIISQERCSNVLFMGTTVHRIVDCKVKFTCQEESRGDVWKMNFFGQEAAGVRRWGECQTAPGQQAHCPRSGEARRKAPRQG